MINLEKFINGEVVFKVTYENVMDFLDLIESTTSLVWRSGDKPTKFIPPNGSLESLKAMKIIYIGVSTKLAHRPCLEYSTYTGYTNNKKVEVY